MYQKIDDRTIYRTSDGACIPVNEENKDYQAYLSWVRAGNTAAPYVAGE